MDKERLLCSFSGGKTSAYMAAVLKERFSWKYDICYVFANTGQENEETLEFVRDVDWHFKLGVVWVEADISKDYKRGTRHKIVTFETATRDNSLFAAMCAKYGIPNHAAPHCTRELKQNPIKSYIKSKGWGYNWLTAIGIRTDETRRAKGRARKIVYPLIDWFPADKQDIDTFWEEMPFNLRLLPYQGNCKWCWKKADAKLFRIANETPDIFIPVAQLEKEYGRSGPKFRKDPSAPNEVFFRSRRSAEQMLEAARTWADNGGMDKPMRERGASDGCSESCEFILTS